MKGKRNIMNIHFIYSKTDDAWYFNYVNLKGDKRQCLIFSLDAQMGDEMDISYLDTSWCWVDQDIESGDLQVLGKEDTTFAAAIQAAVEYIMRNR